MMSYFLSSGYAANHSFVMETVAVAIFLENMPQLTETHSLRKKKSREIKALQEFIPSSLYQEREV